ncbi:MAG: nitroreductase [Promethearchaeota archaeon CR_4]|nr:MAG: nitroreductase [Candidatus Lokiarchaeota archaeon CR_4]
MELSRTIVDVIRMRSSWRSYNNQPIEPDKLTKMCEFMRSLTTGPFGGHARFEFLESANLDLKKANKLGTYGVVTGAQYFIVGVKKQTPMDLEDYGYLFEKIILLATDLGLGTVWLGGTFTRGAFGKHMNLQDNESIPAVAPVGYVTEKRSWVDSFARYITKATTRKPWEQLFFLQGFDKPIPYESSEPFSMPLEMVRLAPSAKNWQPWRVVKDQDTKNFHFYIQRRYKGRKYDEITRIDGGIAMCHFALTAEELRLPGKWIVNDPNFTDLPPNVQYMASWEVN